MLTNEEVLKTLMARYSTTQARRNLEKLIDLALAGEEVVITRAGRTIGRIIPTPSEPNILAPESPQARLQT